MAKFLADAYQPNVSLVWLVGHEAPTSRVVVTHGPISRQHLDMPVALAFHVLKLTFEDHAGVETVASGETLGRTLAEHGAEPPLASTAVRQPGAAVASGGAVAEISHYVARRG